MKLPNIVELESAFKNTDFGQQSREDVLCRNLTSISQGYAIGRTARMICLELGLIHYSHVKDALHLTKKGCAYLSKYGFYNI